MAGRGWVPAILTACEAIVGIGGVVLVLVATVFYWPLVRRSEGLAALEKYRRNSCVLVTHRFDSWIKQDSKRRAIFRTLVMLSGFGAIALAFWLRQQWQLQ